MSLSASAPPPEIEGMFTRLREGMIGYFPAFLTKPQLDSQIDKFQRELKRAIVGRDEPKIAIMGKRIDQFVEYGNRPDEVGIASQETMNANLSFHLRRIASEALVQEWNENPWILTKAELIQKAIHLLESPARQQEILDAFTTISSNGKKYQPHPDEFQKLMDDAIAYLREEMTTD